MSQSDKSAYYKTLQARGVQFSKHYREYTTAELAEMLAEMAVTGDAETPPPAEPVATPAPAPQAAPANEMPGERLNRQAEDEPLFTDEDGKVWFQVEVSKPAYPKPRGRRVLSYTETGTKMQQVITGDKGQFVETFEVSGDSQSKRAEVKITLPSYQVGKYLDKRFPWKIWTYAGQRGFDLFEIQAYFGGADLVPTEVKRIYVDNVLCYDIRTVIRAVQTEHRRLQLAGKVT